MTGIRAAIAKFNQKADDTDRKLAVNPFSDTYVQPEYDKSADDYGRPKKGSLTEKRGIKAGVHVGREILFLCELIDRTATLIDADGHKCIEFGPLFYSYAHYSDKLVGMLLRARKYGLVAFDGEMLYQRQDDHKIVTLMRPVDDIRLAMVSSGDPAHCLKFAPTPP